VDRTVRVWTVAVAGPKGKDVPAVVNSEHRVLTPAKLADNFGSLIQALEFSPDSDYVAVYIPFNQFPQKAFGVKVYDLKVGKEVKEFGGVAITDEWRAMTFGPNGRFAYHDGNAVVVRDSLMGRNLLQIPDRPDTRQMIFSPSGDRLIINRQREMQVEGSVGKELYAEVWSVPGQREEEEYRSLKPLPWPRTSPSPPLLRGVYEFDKAEKVVPRQPRFQKVEIPKDYDPSGTTWAVSPDGKRVAYHYSAGSGPTRRSLLLV
jgi:hypothetical protein